MKKLLTLLIAALILTGCSTKKELQRFQGNSVEVGFDTTITFVAYAKNQKEFDQYFDIVKEEYIFYNKLFDKYNNYEGVNNIKTINDQAGIAPVEVDPIIIDLMKRSKEYYEDSEGYFDITFGSVLEIWHDYRDDGEAKNEIGELGDVPPMEVLEEANQYAGWKFVEVDEVNNTVYLTHERTRLDVGAIAKGYATEMVALSLEEKGLEYGIVSGGGNVRTINTKADGSPWAIGIEEPSVIIKNESLDIFSIPHSMSVVTSGNYQRYYVGPDEVHYSHLVNPFTLMPTSDFDAAVIITPDSTMADALSTALYMMSYEEGLEFVERFNKKYPDKLIDVAWITDQPIDGWYETNGYYYNMTEPLKQYSRNLTETEKAE